MFHPFCVWVFQTMFCELIMVISTFGYQKFCIFWKLISTLIIVPKKLKTSPCNMFHQLFNCLKSICIQQDVSTQICVLMRQNVCPSLSYRNIYQQTAKHPSQTQTHETDPSWHFMFCIKFKGTFNVNDNFHSKVRLWFINANSASIATVLMHSEIL